MREDAPLEDGLGEGERRPRVPLKEGGRGSHGRLRNERGDILRKESLRIGREAGKRGGGESGAENLATFRAGLVGGGGRFAPRRRTVAMHGRSLRVTLEPGQDTVIRERQPADGDHENDGEPQRTISQKRCHNLT